MCADEQDFMVWGKYQDSVSLALETSKPVVDWQVL